MADAIYIKCFEKYDDLLKVDSASFNVKGTSRKRK
jgi:hypothetical protein